MAKRGPRPPAKTPAGKRLTKRERAQAIAAWAETLRPLREAKALPPHAPPTKETNETNEPPPTSAAAGPDASSPEKPDFFTSEWPPEAPKKTPRRKTRANGKASPEKTAKRGNVSAPPEEKATPVDERDRKATPPVSIDTNAQEAQGPASEPVAQNEGENGDSSGDAPQAPEEGDEEPAADASCPTYAALDAKHQRFVEEYLVDNNGAAAARRANYSKATAKEQACRLLTNVHIQAAIAEKRAELAARHLITKDQIIAELRASAFANQADYIRVTSDGEPYIDLADCSREQLGALQSVSVEDYVEGRGEDARQVKRVMVKTVDKLRAMTQLADLLGYSPKKQVEHSGGVKVTATSEKGDALAERIRRMDTETLKQLDALARQQEALLAGEAPPVPAEEPAA